MMQNMSFTDKFTQGGGGPGAALPLTVAYRIKYR